MPSAYKFLLYSPVSCSIVFICTLFDLLQFSTQRQLVKKISSGPKIEAQLQPNGEAEVEAEIAPVNGVSSLQLDAVPNNDFGNSMIRKQIEENSLVDMTKVGGSKILFPHSPMQI